jgi:8-oxo-dGTP diphosphatase
MSTTPYKLVLRGILIENGKVLLCRRSTETKSYPGLWEFPGGKVDPGENLADSLIREFKEETGLDIRLKKVWGAGEAGNENLNYVYLFFLVENTSGAMKISPEHSAFGWFDKEGLKDIKASPYLYPIINMIINIL